MSRPPDPDRATLEADPRVVWTHDIVRFGDLDPNGHVNNAVFAVYCQGGRICLLDAVLGPALAPGRYLVVAHLAIAFRNELRHPGRVVCATWLSGLGRTSITMDQALYDEDDGRLVATAAAVTVLMDSSTRGATPLDDDLRALFAPRLRSTGPAARDEAAG